MHRLSRGKRQRGRLDARREGVYSFKLLRSHTRAVSRQWTRTVTKEEGSVHCRACAWACQCACQWACAWACQCAWACNLKWAQAWASSWAWACATGLGPVLGDASGPGLGPASGLQVRPGPARTRHRACHWQPRCHCQWALAVSPRWAVAAAAPALALTQAVSRQCTKGEC